MKTSCLLSPDASMHKRLSLKLRSKISFSLIFLASFSVPAVGQWEFEPTGTSVLGNRMSSIVAIDQTGKGILRLGCEDGRGDKIVISVVLMDKIASHNVRQPELQADSDEKQILDFFRNAARDQFFAASAKVDAESEIFARIIKSFLEAKQSVSLWIDNEEYKFSAQQLKPALDQLEAKCMLRKAARLTPAEPNSETSTTATIPSSPSSKAQLTVPPPRLNQSPLENSGLPNQANSSAGTARLLINMARQQINLGNIAAARALLDQVKDGEAKFALAETYDPQVLDSWGVVGTKSDINKAYTLYQEAAKLGNTAAVERLRTGLAMGLSRP